MIVRIKSEAELVELTKELLHIIVNLRFHSSIWEREYGYLHKMKKKSWEKKADDLIEKLGAEKARVSAEYKITILPDQE